MNDNEYGGFSYNKNDDGKKELRISDKDNFDDVINACRENNLNPNAQNIDQIVFTPEGENPKNDKASKLVTDFVTDLVNLDLSKAERMQGKGTSLPHLSKVTIVIILILALVAVGIMVCGRFLM